MSQAGEVNVVQNHPSIPTMFVTNSGTAVPIANTLDILGTSVAAGSTPIQTTGATNIVTIQVQTSQAIAATDATKIGLAAFKNTQFSVDANGFVSTSGTGVVNTLTGNSGGAVSPTAGNINTVGTGSITVVGNPGTSTLTAQLTGLTAHNILLGEGTATVGLVAPTANTGAVLQNNSGADPTYSTATYPSTTTINQILYSSSANTVAGLATANNGVLTTGTSGTPVITALASDGQLIIGSSAGAPAAATLSAGSGIAITNGHNSITIAATGAGFAWSDQSGSFNAAAENGYFITATSTATLPASPTEGQTIAFIVDTTQILTITANTGQVIRIGAAVSASAGTAANNARGDAVELVYRSTGASWIALSVIGTFTVT